MMEKLITGFQREPLTEREIEVLQLVAAGKSNREIGQKLYISESTVKGHLHHLFSKLSVLSRTEAISVATRRGLIQA